MLYLDICAWAPEFLVTPLLMGPVSLISQGRFERNQSAPGLYRKYDRNKSRDDNWWCDLFRQRWRRIAAGRRLTLASRPQSTWNET